MDELLELRKKIDEIDEKLIPLLKERMEVSKKVAAYKIKNGLPVLNEERERRILKAVYEKGGEAVETVYSVIIRVSKDIQQKIIDG